MAASARVFDNGNTCPFNDLYSEACPEQSEAPDVVYQYTPAEDECVDIWLCNTLSGVDFKLYVYASDAGSCPVPRSGETGLDIAGDDDGCAPYPRIMGLSLNASVTCWIVIDGSGDPPCGGYRINIALCGVFSDGYVDFGDINPFVLALVNPDAYETAYPECNLTLGDINDDGFVDFGDINPFVLLLSSGG